MSLSVKPEILFEYQPWRLASLRAAAASQFPLSEQSMFNALSTAAIVKPPAAAVARSPGPIGEGGVLLGWAAALTACRLHKATLLIAKLDRLSRSVRTLAAIMDSGVEFACADNPHANRLTLHLMAAMAEYERDMISQRTKAALAVAKARGVKLGNPNGAAHLHDKCHEAVAASAAARKARALSDAEAPKSVLADIG
jgi:hypothetical protein